MPADLSEPAVVSVRFAIPENAPVRLVIVPVFEPLTVQVLPEEMSEPAVVSVRFAIPENAPVRLVQGTQIRIRISET